MKRNLSWFDKTMAAVTFAEANEHTAGKNFLTITDGDSEKVQKCNKGDAALAPGLRGAEIKA
jgi:hypothetical protein